MSDLVAAIDAFLAKYPDAAALEWRGSKRKASALDVMVSDLLQTGERRLRLSGLGADTGLVSTASESPSTPRGGPPSRPSPEVVL